jgi:hypothetical protein
MKKAPGFANIPNILMLALLLAGLGLTLRATTLRTVTQQQAAKYPARGYCSDPKILVVTQDGQLQNEVCDYLCQEGDCCGAQDEPCCPDPDLAPICDQNMTCLNEVCTKN